jgi:hypothetical protein
MFIWGYNSGGSSPWLFGPIALSLFLGGGGIDLGKPCWEHVVEQNCSAHRWEAKKWERHQGPTIFIEGMPPMAQDLSLVPNT